MKKTTLVISRKLGESVEVDGPTVMKVTATGRRVTLSITADESVKILRSELNRELDQASQEGTPEPPEVYEGMQAGSTTGGFGLTDGGQDD